MSIAIVTGSGGLIGSETCRFFAEKGFDVVGIDNDMRSFFFGKEASTRWQVDQLRELLGERYRHHSIDIRDKEEVQRIFSDYHKDIKVIIHTAAQPSHDWATKSPEVDFTVNANGTLNLLEACRSNCPEAVFIFTSTNKVYGDTPNRLPLHEHATRWEIDDSHQYASGISEDMSIDNTLHSLFGASKVAADILVQEYGKYYDMKTVCFRGGCLTGPYHSGAQLHGFLAYLMKCAVVGTEYTIFGYNGKQVRDNIYSKELIEAFYEYYKNPRQGEVYNIGGGRDSNCSMHEAIQLCQELTGRAMSVKYSEVNRVGDHIWWISDLSKFKKHYPDWRIKYDVPTILKEIYEYNKDRWLQGEDR